MAKLELSFWEWMSLLLGAFLVPSPLAKILQGPKLNETKPIEGNIMEGIKELKEAVVGLNELSLIIIKHVKDGLSFEDAVAVAVEAAANSDVKAAIEGISKVPAEIGDIDLAEGVELVVVQAQYVPKILAALKA